MAGSMVQTLPNYCLEYHSLILLSSTYNMSSQLYDSACTIHECSDRWISAVQGVSVIVQLYYPFLRSYMFLFMVSHKNCGSDTCCFKSLTVLYLKYRLLR